MSTVLKQLFMLLRIDSPTAQFSPTCSSIVRHLKLHKIVIKWNLNIGYAYVVWITLYSICISMSPLIWKKKEI